MNATVTNTIKQGKNEVIVISYTSAYGAAMEETVNKSANTDRTHTYWAYIYGDEALAAVKMALPFLADVTFDKRTDGHDDDDSDMAVYHLSVTMQDETDAPAPLDAMQAVKDAEANPETWFPLNHDGEQVCFANGVWTVASNGDSSDYTEPTDAADALAYQWMQARVNSNPELQEYENLIFADWSQGREHSEWVANAPISEITSWARSLEE